MLRPALVLAAFMVTLGVARASPPERRPVHIDWTLTVTDDNMEKHQFAFMRDGGPIKVHVPGWKCVYDPVTAHEDAPTYVETSGLRCTVGKYTAATALMCASRAVSGARSATLFVGTSPKVDQIDINCDPQD
jgi:hypothetical protein